MEPRSGAEGRAVPVFFSGSYNLPVLIEIVDSKEKLAELFPFLEKHGNCHFLAVISPLMALYTQYVSEHTARMKRSKLPRIQEDEAIGKIISCGLVERRCII